MEKKKNSKPVPKQLKPFVPGDPRINRKGRQPNALRFEALRLMAKEIAEEKAYDKYGKPILDRKGKPLTNAQMVLRKMMIDDPAKFLEISYGKIPQPIEMEGEVTIMIEKIVSDDSTK